MKARQLVLGVWCSVLVLSPAVCRAQVGYETLAALTEPRLKTDLLSEADFNAVKSRLQATFESFSKYLFQVGRGKAGRDAIFIWDSYDNPGAYDVYGVVSLYGKIQERWGTEVLHANYPEFLGEKDRTYLAYLSQLQSPVDKLRRHAEALASAYRNAAKAAAKTLPEFQSTKDLTAYIEEGYLSDFTARVRVLREKGERDLLRKKLRGSDPKERFRMAWAITDLKAEEFEPDMAALLLDRDDDVKVQSILFFAFLKKTSYEDQIGKMLDDPSAEVREYAADYVGRVKAVRYSGKLERLLSDPNENVRVWAKKSLDSMKP